MQTIKSEMLHDVPAEMTATKMIISDDESEELGKIGGAPGSLAATHVGA